MKISDAFLADNVIDVDAREFHGLAFDEHEPPVAVDGKERDGGTGGNVMDECFGLAASAFGTHTFGNVDGDTD